MKYGLLAIILISLLIFTILTINESTRTSIESSQEPSDTEESNEPRMLMLKFPISFIFLVIAFLTIFLFIIYWAFEVYFQRNIKIISNVIKDDNLTDGDNISKPDITNVFLNLLNLNEKKIVKKLIDKDGKILQSEISRMETMNRVKAHRTVRDLERKGIVKIEQNGNTNIISLTKEVKKLLSSRNYESSSLTY